MRDHEQNITAVDTSFGPLIVESTMSHGGTPDQLSADALSRPSAKQD